MKMAWFNWTTMERYPLVMTNIAMENPQNKWRVYSWENHHGKWAIFHGYVK
jgi:hypothetical protein